MLGLLAFHQVFRFGSKYEDYRKHEGVHIHIYIYICICEYFPNRYIDTATNVENTGIHTEQSQMTRSKAASIDLERHAEALTPNDLQPSGLQQIQHATA